MPGGERAEAGGQQLPHVLNLQGGQCVVVQECVHTNIQCFFRIKSMVVVRFLHCLYKEGRGEVEEGGEIRITLEKSADFQISSGQEGNGFGQIKR